jgi:hypothetical protein
MKSPVIIGNRTTVLRPMSSHYPDWEELKNEARRNNRIAIFQWATVTYKLTILASLTEHANAEVTLWSCTWKVTILNVGRASCYSLMSFFLPFPHFLPKIAVKTLSLDHYWELLNALQFSPYWTSYILTPYRLLWDTDSVFKCSWGLERNAIDDINKDIWSAKNVKI